MEWLQQVSAIEFGVFLLLWSLGSWFTMNLIHWRRQWAFFLILVLMVTGVIALTGKTRDLVSAQPPSDPRGPTIGATVLTPRGSMNPRNHDDVLWDFNYGSVRGVAPHVFTRVPEVVVGRSRNGDPWFVLQCRATGNCLRHIEQWTTILVNEASRKRVDPWVVLGLAYYRLRTENYPRRWSCPNGMLPVSIERFATGHTLQRTCDTSSNPMTQERLLAEITAIQLEHLSQSLNRCTSLSEGLAVFNGSPVCQEQPSFSRGVIDATRELRMIATEICRRTPSLCRGSNNPNDPLGGL
jgi:hypothetical protein